MRQEAGNFVDDTYKELSTDALFSLSLQDGQKLQIGILLEHKSYPDADIGLQLLRYQANIYAAQKKWAPLLVFVFYHGERRWNQSVTFADSASIDEKHKSLLLPKVLNFTYELFDLSKEEYTHLKLSLEMQSILYVLRNIWRLDEAEYIDRLIHQFLSKLKSVNFVLWKKIVDYWLHMIDLPIEKVVAHFPDVDKEEIMSTATQIEQKGIEKGKIEGKTEGKIEGKTEGKIEGKIEAARAMLKKGYPLADIIDITDLNEEQLRRVGLIK